VAISCDPTTLANAAQCFECAIPFGGHMAVQTMLLAQIRAALIPGASTDPGFIANEARCFECTGGNLSAMQVLLLCNIVTALGG
jgi:hypothetical protein